MANEKYALLDTDFISKMHLIRKDDHNKLIDKIMAMPGYCFYCHKQIQVEIMRHNIAGAPEWFQSKIESKSICMYDDEMILAGNVVIDTDPAGNIKVTKAKSKEKIDGIVAAIMALDRCIRQEGQSGSVYDERGLLVF